MFDEVRPDGIVGASVSIITVILNVAVTVVSALIVIVQVPAPLHPPPDHPANVEPDAGVAVKVETVPEVTPETEQVAPQFMEPPDEVTVPEPVPFFETERV